MYAETNPLGFEIQTCSRCGGSGSYSYNMMHGSRCYGCSGTGKVFTKRGSMAYARFQENLKKPVSAVQVGDFVKSGNKWRKLEAIGQSTSYNIRPDGTRLHYVELTFKGYAECVFPDSIVQSVRNEAERQAALGEAIAYQASLTKQGKPKA